ncbi:MAG: family 1 glycosylhydrolase [Pirellulales bacterium]|nr:family 1 glycosylhydrolase [Pirellulales bacterium]
MDLQMWGGLECTVNRVRNRYFDQLHLSGHRGAQSLQDLELLAGMGLTALRYPVLWEHHGTAGGSLRELPLVERQLEKIKSLGMEPIVGLLHHGSGPPGTDLLSANFVEGFSTYAARIAQKFPWIEYYTPINEPLTTARFSGLYGHWYPHKRSDRDFALMLLQQCRAILSAMRQIQRINPRAKLVFTENLEYVHSTPPLKYQTDFENERRWLSADLILGKVGRGHPLWDYFRDAKVNRGELEWFQRNKLVRGVILGWNYYVTSERFLDHRISLYPPRMHGGNNRHAYVDVEAVRIRRQGLLGLECLLTQAWERYGLPLALTECHLACHRESQLRWLWDAWQAGRRLRKQGVDLRAVTAWSMFGSHNWNHLCTRDDGHYESGVFDIRGQTRRPTALAHLVKHLTQKTPLPTTTLIGKGWWNGPERFCYSPFNTATESKVRRSLPTTPQTTAKILILGANGTLGRAFQWACRERGLDHVACVRNQVDITDSNSVAAMYEQWRPWAIINAAGYVRVDQAESDPRSCQLANVTGPAQLACLARARGVRLLTFSSDLVFDGRTANPYLENAAVRPLSTYGRTKALAEDVVLAIDKNALVVRTSAFFGPWDDANFLTSALRRLAAGERISAARDWVVSPTYVPDLVHNCLDLLMDGESGVWHLANDGRVSWAEFACQAAEIFGFSRVAIHACPGRELNLPAPRPAYSALASTRGYLLPTLANSLERYHAELISSNKLAV